MQIQLSTHLLDITYTRPWPHYQATMGTRMVVNSELSLAKLNRLTKLAVNNTLVLLISKSQWIGQSSLWHMLGNEIQIFETVSTNLLLLCTIIEWRIRNYKLTGPPLLQQQSWIDRWVCDLYQYAYFPCECYRLDSQYDTAGGSISKKIKWVFTIQAGYCQQCIPANRSCFRWYRIR